MQYNCVKLKELRLEKGFTQKQLSEMSGFSIYKIRQWEKCISYPNLHDAVVLCINLNVELDYLRGTSQTKKIIKYENYNDEDDKNFKYIILD